MKSCAWPLALSCARKQAMAQLMQFHPVLMPAWQCNQISPQQAWELDLSISLDLPLTREGHLLMLWARLVDCQVDLLTEQ
jgi:hypothetical protein